MSFARVTVSVIVIVWVQRFLCRDAFVMTAACKSGVLITFCMLISKLPGVEVIVNGCSMWMQTGCWFAWYDP